MPQYEIEQYELHAMKYRVKAASEAEAIRLLFDGEAIFIAEPEHSWEGNRPLRHPTRVAEGVSKGKSSPGGTRCCYYFYCVRQVLSCFLNGGKRLLLFQ